MSSNITEMGNPLSPSAAEVSMRKFETDTKKSLTEFPKTWIRYVDDIFVIIDIDFNVETFIENLNFQYFRIKFTFEEVDERLPLLSLYIKKTNEKLEFKLYRNKS